MRNLKRMGALKHVEAYEIMHFITDRFTGQLRIEHLNEIDQWEETNGDLESEAEWLLDFIEKVVRKMENCTPIMTKGGTKQ